MTCLPDYTTWPHKTTCSDLQDVGSRCEEDWDCKQGLFCWYPTVADIHFNKKCMTKLALPDGSKFGFRKLTENDDGSNMIRNGLACTSGTARWTGVLNEAECFTIDHLESDGYDNDPMELDPPY